MRAASFPEQVQKAGPVTRTRLRTELTEGDDRWMLEMILSGSTKFRCVTTRKGVINAEQTITRS